ncbi:UDP-N-acetylglucosamine 2-epimerase (non-hydrolyzing) [Mesorhizobium sp. DCY119]|uniref:non-hydrolyzing UDP-N-acetylglucosamine 2-epimerase n=1 Tax=Mesorhizobium sp. DCY119 TaxID=2108445 RepID=UPI000E6BBBAB|nr:UDP-N-acetylglucosamine 2-epimerase (non-hydrolyzing) [Mesorhizobium sp. DCY119]RJG43349.1 UDP-N-acetylglucosamine 2-epimerase (non-hydrolyzing) [Mesorhizobium sp. DCY119]
MRKVLIVYGTRPEAIKMAPLIDALSRSRHCKPVVAVTGQHRAMLDQVNDLFGIRPSHDLNIITERQRLEDITSRVLDGVSKVIEAEEPDAVLVQGDTTTCFAAALAAFYRKVPVVHLEAGLRTGDPYNPFPEEANRRLTTQLAAVHLAPTSTSRENLLRDGIHKSNIVVTGNTVIDALLDVVSRDLPAENPDLGKINGRRSVLITAHRRESWGEPMARTARAIARLARTFPDIAFLLPAHLNPAVREVLLPPLAGLDNVLITAPLGYSDFVRAMYHCSVVLTDSGGVQEEAPSLGKPVLVMRDSTERPEAVSAGTVRLVGTDEDLIVDEVSTLLTSKAAYQTMAHAVNPYGDGHAAERSVRAIEHFFGIGDLPVEFDPTIRIEESVSPRRAAQVVSGFAA